MIATMGTAMAKEPIESRSDLSAEEKYKLRKAETYYHCKQRDEMGVYYYFYPEDRPWRDPDAEVREREREARRR